MRRSRSIRAILGTTAVVAAIGCDGGDGSRIMDPGDGPVGPDAGRAALTAVAPVGPNVEPGALVEIGFSHSMYEEAAQWAVVHMGDPTGPLVDGTWTWSDDHAHLTFHPEIPWASGGEYTIHLGGGMHDAFGNPLDFESHGVGMGGEWASAGMMGGGPMMMEPGWRHANGSYGMVFRFTAGS